MRESASAQTPLTHVPMALPRRCLVSALAILCVALATVANAAGPQQPDRPKRVLMVHSFGSSAPPFTTHSTAFETTLTREMGKSVDLDEVSLDMARYAQS